MMFLITFHDGRCYRRVIAPMDRLADAVARARQLAEPSGDPVVGSLNLETFTPGAVELPPLEALIVAAQALGMDERLRGECDHDNRP